MTVESNQKVIYEMAAWKLRAEVAEEERLAAAEARVVAAEADAVKWHEYGLRMSNDACLAEDRAVAAEAERDALVAALERIATGNFLEAWDAQQIARAYLAAVSATGASGAAQDTASPAPAEPPRLPSAIDLATYESSGPVETTQGKPRGAYRRNPPAPAEPPERPDEDATEGANL